MIFNRKTIICPACEQEITLEKIPASKFPDAFYHMGADPKAAHIENDRVSQWIEHCVRTLRNDPDQDFTFLSSGDTFVGACLFGKCIEIIVAQGYWHGIVEPDDLEHISC